MQERGESFKEFLDNKPYPLHPITTTTTTATIAITLPHSAVP